MDKKNTSQRVENLSPLKQALYAVEDMKNKLGALKKEKHEPIAIVGMACRFPQAQNHREFWELLKNGVDAIEEVPHDRWDIDEFYSGTPGDPGKMNSRYGGFIKDVDKFDPQFFGISPREATKMDPQQRLALETTWKALEDAGIPPASVRKTLTGVFLGVAGNDYLSLAQNLQDYQDIDAYGGSGNASSIVANRLSYFFDFHGPSMSIDTACSSSLVAVHQAITSLRNKESNMAVAGGVNALLSPRTSITFSQANMLAPGGRCRTFDASAEGYVRGEGCGIIVLKRLSDAQKDGDPILAVIRGSAANQDGRTNGLTAPNSLAQVRVIEAALQNARLTADKIHYIETHGTGTILGDPIEVEALGKVMKDRSKDRPCYIGSVKTNIGHLEATAGIAGVIKTVLALKHRTIPPHLHFKTINPNIPMDELPLDIPTAPVPWKHQDEKFRAGVSAFGFGGTNAHVVLEEAPAVPESESRVDPRTYVFTWSAKDQEVLNSYVHDYKKFLESNDVNLQDMSFTLQQGRESFNHRLALAASSTEELRQKLTAIEAGEIAGSGHMAMTPVDEKKTVAFLFTGQGAQYLNMGKSLYERHPEFRAVLDEINDISKEFGDPILSVMWGEDRDRIHHTEFTQPALFAIEYALARLWMSWGVKPQAVMGHSIGEITAACIAGVLSPRDAYKLVSARGRLMGSLPAGGGMAAIFAEQDVVEQLIADTQTDVSLAGVNGTTNIAISGPEAEVDRFLTECEQREIKTRKLTVSHAFHSRLMDPILEEFEQIAGELQYHAPHIPLVSNLTGTVWGNGQFPDAAYWRDHVRQPVLFLQGLHQLTARHINVFVEAGPNPHLTGMGRRSLPDYPAVWIPSIKEGKEDWPFLLDAVAQVFAHGVNIDWAAFQAPFGGKRIQVPTYPFKRERYWLEDKRQARQQSSPDVVWAVGEKVHPLLGYELNSPLQTLQFQNRINGDHDPFLNGFSLFNRKIFPSSAFVEMGLEAGRKLFKSDTYNIEAVRFTEELVMSENGDGMDLQFIVTPEQDGKSATFQAFSLRKEAEQSTWVKHAEGKLIQGKTDAPQTLAHTPSAIKKECTPRSADDFYEALEDHGLCVDNKARIFSEIYVGENTALTKLKISDDVRNSMSKYNVHPLFIDACCQTICMLAQEAGDVFMPYGLERQINVQNGYADVWTYAKIDQVDADSLVGEVYLLNEKGDVHAYFQGIRLTRVDEEKKKQWQRPTVSEKTLSAPKETSTPKTTVTRADIFELPEAERHDAITTYMREELAKVLSLPVSQISANLPITNMGLDSIMAVELQTKLERDLGFKLPVAKLIVGPTLSQLADQVVESLTDESSSVSIMPQHGVDYGEFPLSLGQEALWVQHQVAPKSVYNPIYAVRSRSKLDTDALQYALQMVVNRHPALRTTFHSRKGEQIQKVHEYMDVHFEYHDVSALSEQDIKERIEELSTQVYDLTQGPLFKAVLFEKATDDHILVIAAHHIVTDMWSLALIISEIAQFYVQGSKDFNVLPLKLRYTDYVVWQQNMLEDAQGEQLWKYWSQKLKGRLPTLELPTDKPRPAVQTFNGKIRSIKLDAELTQKLEALSEKHGATLYMTLLAAFKILMHKYSGLDDIIVGTPTTGRSRPELTDLVGYFVNPVALRSFVDKQQSFDDFIPQVKDTVVGALEHQDYPFYRLVERIMPVRDPSRTPVFQVMFVYQKAHVMNNEGLSSMSLGIEGEHMEFAGIPLETVPIDDQVSPFDFTLMLAEASDGLGASLTYNTDLFEEETVLRMLEHYKTVLENIVDNPAQPIAQLQIVPYEELYQLLFGWNDTHVPLPKKRCIQYLFDEQVSHYPDQVAVDFEGTQLTYTELDERANQLGRYLRDKGVGPETIVGLCVDRSIETVLGLLGILKAGGAYMPLDPYYPKERLEYMITHSRVQRVITMSPLLEHLPEFSGEYVCMDQEWTTIDEQSVEPIECVNEHNHLAYIIYTSGSTGQPKGVMLTHEGLVNLVQAQIKVFNVKPNSRVMQYASFSFDASVSEIFMALIAGARLYMISRETMLSQNGLLRAMKENDITTITLPPSILAVLPEAELPKLDTIISAGEACTKNIVNKWNKNHRFINAYGPTESTVCTTANVVEGQVDSDNIPIGKSIDNLRVYVVDSDMNPVPIGVPGELLIGGIGLARGYFDRPDLTAEKFIPNPWGDYPGDRLYRSGDLVRYLSNGQIEFLGRIDHQVKIRGLRVELGEIESVLLSYEHVENAVVLARRDKTGETRLAAYYISTNNEELPYEAIADFMKKKLPPYMVPSTFMKLKEFPLTQNGKIDRKSFPDPFFKQNMTRSNIVKPKNEIERTIAEAWRKVLNINQVSVNDNFFEIGGHSLMMVKLHALLEQSLKKELSVVELFQYPTIASQAKFLSKGNNDEQVLKSTEERASRQRARMAQQRQRMRQRRE